MRILWLGNPPGTPTGYGEQAALWVPRLQAMGHDLAVACNWGVQGFKLEIDGVPFYPHDGAWGNLALPAYAAEHEADLVIALCDAWVLEPHRWPEELAVAVWAPVDHDPLPRPVLERLADHRMRPIAMSRFGEQQMAAAGLEPLYVPHGVDCSLFRPRPEIRDAVRAELGIPADAYLVGMVAANQGNPTVSRKSYPQAFLAFARFAADRPDAYLYAHTTIEGPLPGVGMALDRLARGAGCPLERLRFPPARAWQLGMPAHLVANLYQAFDVLLNPSMGEGFGIPILEAQACGVPVIASNHSAMTELVCAGWLVGGDPWWDSGQDSWMLCPSVASIHEALEAAYEGARDPALRDTAAAWAAGYDADLVADVYWRPALDQLAAPREAAPLEAAVA